MAIKNPTPPPSVIPDGRKDFPVFLVEMSQIDARFRGYHFADLSHADELGQRIAIVNGMNALRRSVDLGIVGSVTDGEGDGTIHHYRMTPEAEVFWRTSIEAGCSPEETLNTWIAAHPPVAQPQ